MTVTIERERDRTRIIIDGEAGRFTDAFPDRASAKEWGTDVLVAYYDMNWTDARRVVDEAGCDCNGESHSIHCWWATTHDDGREQNAW